MGKLKQLFCNHKYIMYLDIKPCYISCGDKVQDRKSKKYYMTCCKCDKEMEVIKHWTAEK